MASVGAPAQYRRFAVKVSRYITHYPQDYMGDHDEISKWYSCYLLVGLAAVKRA